MQRAEAHKPGEGDGEHPNAECGMRNTGKPPRAPRPQRAAIAGARGRAKSRPRRGRSNGKMFAYVRLFSLNREKMFEDVRRFLALGLIWFQKSARLRVCVWCAPGWEAGLC